MKPRKIGSLSGHVRDDGEPKMAFGTREDAVRFEPYKSPYRCSLCDKWHVATPKSPEHAANVRERNQRFLEQCERERANRAAGTSYAAKRKAERKRAKRREARERKRGEAGLALLGSRS